MNDIKQQQQKNSTHFFQSSTDPLQMPPAGLCLPVARDDVSHQPSGTHCTKSEAHGVCKMYLYVCVLDIF